MNMKAWLVYILLTLSTPPLIANEVPKLNIVLDTSGSMHSYINPIAESILEIKQHSQHDDSATNNIGLFSFTDKIEMVSEGDSNDIYSAIKNIKIAGGVEDGFIAVDKILADETSTGSHIILFTDEGRDVVKDIDLEELITQAIAQNIKIHAFLTTQKLCGTYQTIGFNSDFSVLNEDNTWGTCSQVAKIDELRRNFRPKNNDYVKLALHTGGMVWSLNSIFGGRFTQRERGMQVETFSNYIASELANSESKLFSVNILLSGEIELGSIVTIDASEAETVEGEVSADSWQWDLNNDGVVDDYGPNVNIELTENSPKFVTLWLTADLNGEEFKESHIVYLRVRNKFY